MSTLQRVYEAFVHGRDRPPSKAFTAPGRLFGELLNAKMHSRLSPEESAVVESCWGGQYRGLLATRKDQIEQAKQEFETVRSVLRAGSLSVEASLLVQVLLEPAEAYLYYKLDDYERAREFVARSSSFNHQLTDKFEYEIVSAQRMQLCHNILRIHTKQGQRKETVNLASSYLDYLEFGDNKLPDDISWAWIVRNAVPESIIQYYFDQICGEAALALAGTHDAEFFQPLAHHSNRERCRSAFGSHAHAWIASKDTMLKSDWENYLDQACELLQLGRTAELSLWFATIIDVVSVCKLLGTEGMRVANQISEEASKIADAPWLLRSDAVGGSP